PNEIHDGARGAGSAAAGPGPSPGRAPSARSRAIWGRSAPLPRPCPTSASARPRPMKKAAQGNGSAALVGVERFGVALDRRPFLPGERHVDRITTEPEVIVADGPGREDRLALGKLIAAGCGVGSEQGDGAEDGGTEERQAGLAADRQRGARDREGLRPAALEAQQAGLHHKALRLEIARAQSPGEREAVLELGGRLVAAPGL